jgi:hypothetical protein
MATRDSEQMRFLEYDITDFIVRHKPGRRTLFLFSGGFGSKLYRARTAYDGNVTGPQQFDYDKIWLNAETFLGDALEMKLAKHRDGSLRDNRSRIIVAWGPTEFLGCTAYDRFKDWCNNNGFNWFIFGWDWRRRVEEAAVFFVKQFLPVFRAKVQVALTTDPLRDYVLIGHSSGGMVVNSILRRADPILSTMTRAVTVGTPFYGYGEQIHRWFDGEPYFNHLGKDRVRRLMASLPGCYTINYLESSLFNQHKAALMGDPQFPLAGYPSMDTGNPAQRADPYAPVGAQYPAGIDFDLEELERGRITCQDLTGPLTPAQVAKFFNIRGVGTGGNSTVGAITWDRNAPAGPVVDATLVPGDGVQPAWTARLATLPAGNIRNVVDDIDHTFLMESAVTHQKLAEVL